MKRSNFEESELGTQNKLLDIPLATMLVFYMGVTMIANQEGYNLMDLGNERWAIQVVGSGLYHGTLREVIRFVLIKLSMKLTELEKALSDMLRYDHDTAHFGMFGSYIFSYSSNWEKQTYA